MDKLKAGNRFSPKLTMRLKKNYVWQDSLDDIIQYTKTHNGKRIYSWRKQTIKRFFVEVKENHGLRYASMLDIQYMRE